MVNQKILKQMKNYLGLIQKARHTTELPGNNILNHSTFYSGVSFEDNIACDIEVLNGSTMRMQKPKPFQNIPGRIEMRMGDPTKGGSVGWEIVILPRDLQKTASNKIVIPRLNDLFIDCAQDLNDRHTDSIGGIPKRDDYIYFTNAKPQNFIQPEIPFEINIEAIETMFKKVGKRINKPWIKDISLIFGASKKAHYFINSEGSLIFTERIGYNLGIQAQALDKKNKIIPTGYHMYGRDLSKIPNEEFLVKQGNQIIQDLEKILVAPIQSNGEYPVILDTEGMGTILHEAAGHGLEAGNMQQDGYESISTLFLDQMGKRIAPDFLSLYDDPTIQEFNKTELNGYYDFDDEGVKGQKVTLFEDGILKNFLHSRQSAGFFKRKSNGHCRSDSLHNPTTRMGSLFLRSSKEVPFDVLKQELIKECVKQNKEYGLLFTGTFGGWVLPDESVYNTSPKNAFRIYTNGKEERVQGVYIVGTPHQTINNILLTSNRYRASNGTCGADSGWVPVSEVTPDALIASLEINRIPSNSYSEASLPIVGLPQ